MRETDDQIERLAHEYLTGYFGAVKSPLATVKVLCEALRIGREHNGAMRALESLTPGGSEFVGDVERCIQEIRYHRELQHKIIVDFKKRLDAAEAELDAIRNLSMEELKR